MDAHRGTDALSVFPILSSFSNLGNNKYGRRTQDVAEGRTRLPAAMAAGVVDTLWSFEHLFDAVMGRPFSLAA